MCLYNESINSNEVGTIATHHTDAKGLSVLRLADIDSCECVTVAWMRRFIKAHRKQIDAEVVKLVGNMKSTSLMKPLSMETEGNPMLTKEETETLGKPWLLVGRSFSLVWG